MAPIRQMLRQYRLLAEIDQKTLAAEIGVSASSLCRFEQGKAMDEAATVRLIAWLFTSRA
jgi:DNA-binding XRE family transcriptional regulator